MAANRYGDTIIACSGSTSTGTNQNCYKYIRLSNQWQLLATSNYVHSRRPGRVYMYNLYILDNSNPETYNLINKTWTSGLNPPLTVGSGACLVVYQDSFIVFGGDVYSRAIQLYNHTTKTWKNLVSLSADYVYSGCTSLPWSESEGKYMVVGGPSSYTQATIFDILNNDIELVPSTLFSRYGSNLITLGNRVFALGGISPATDVVEEYFLSNNSWAISPVKLLMPRYHSSSTPVPATWFDYLPGGCRGVM